MIQYRHREQQPRGKIPLIDRRASPGKPTFEGHLILIIQLIQSDAVTYGGVHRTMGSLKCRNQKEVYVIA